MSSTIDVVGAESGCNSFHSRSVSVRRSMMLLVRKERCPRKAVTGAEGLFAGGNEGLARHNSNRHRSWDSRLQLADEGRLCRFWRKSASNAQAGRPSGEGLARPHSSSTRYWITDLRNTVKASITKSVGAIIETTMPSAATKGTTKEIVPSFSDEVLKAVGGK